MANFWESWRKSTILLIKLTFCDLRSNALGCMMNVCKGGATNERENEWVDKNTFGQAKNNKGRDEQWA